MVAILGVASHSFRPGITFLRKKFICFDVYPGAKAMT
jgi:hypothetical protein